MGIRDRVAQALFGDVIDSRIRAAVKVIDDKWWTQIAGAVGPHDVQWHEKQSELSDALEAWRTNPLAFRIVSLMTDYVVGSGIRILSGVPWVQDFIDSMWEHGRNRLDMRVYRWCDELARSGELFLVLSTNSADGMSYVREVPASRIDKIETDPNDYEQELRYHELRSQTSFGRETSDNGGDNGSPSVGRPRTTEGRPSVRRPRTSVWKGAGGRLLRLLGLWP